MDAKRLIFKSYDEALAYAGDFGRFQKFQFILLNLIAMVGAFHGFNMVFIGATPGHHCNTDLAFNPCNISRETALNYTVPTEHCKERDRTEWAHCDIYNIRNISLLCSSKEISLENISRVSCPNGWEYSKEFYTSTIVTEWDLVCNRYFMRHLADTLFFSGRLIGALIFGRLADRFGRKPVLLFAAMAQAVLGVVTTFSPSFAPFAVFYFFQGIVQCGTFILAFVYITEIVGPSKRKVAAISNKVFYCAGQIILVGLAVLLRDWKNLEMAISLPGVLFITYLWIIPESGRWLLSTGRIEEATQVLRRTARLNGKENYELITLTYSPDHQQQQQQQQGSFNQVKGNPEMLAPVGAKPERHVSPPVEGFKNLFSSLTMVKISLTAWFCWFVNSSTYVGMALITRSLNGNPYVNFLLTAVVELPALLIAFLLIDRVGRKPCIIGFAALAGAASLTGAFIPGGVLNTSFVLLTKFGISGSYAVLFLVSAELFPTSVRNMAVGTAAMCGHLGGTVSPLLLSTRAIYTPLPMIVFGVACLLSTMAVLLLPETLGVILPQTIKDLENMCRPHVREETVEEINSIMKSIENIEVPPRRKNIRSKALQIKESSFTSSSTEIGPWGLEAMQDNNNNRRLL